MSKPDINLHSFNGPDFDGAVVTMLDEIRPGSEISDTLKCSSRLRDFTGRFGVVYGGKEDCIDINNRCERIYIEAQRWVPQGKYLATLKGGSRSIAISGEVEGHGSEVDIDIGNISDQSDNPTKDITLNLRHVAGDPITVRVINGERPKFLNADVQQYKVVLQVPSFFGQLFAKVVHQLRKLKLA